MSRELLTAGELQAAHQRRRCAELGVDGPRDSVCGNEREVVRPNLDHVTQEIESEVSLLIQLRYLSSPACTGSASNSGTLYGCNSLNATRSESSAAERVLSRITTSCSSAILSSQRYRDRAPGKSVPQAITRRSSSARTSAIPSLSLATVVRTTMASVCGMRSVIEGNVTGATCRSRCCGRHMAVDGTPRARRKSRSCCLH